MSTQRIPQSKPKSKVITLPPTVETALTKLNSEIVLVLDTLEIAELNPAPGQTRLRFMDRSDFLNIAYADRFHQPTDPDGNPVGNSIALAPKWLKWPRRRKVNRAVYEPGQPRITDSGDLNTWFPSPNKPKPGDLTLWHTYFNHIFRDDPTHKEWFLAWLAYPLQHSGTKLNTASVLWSKETGTGKSTMAFILREIYGQHNCSLLREADLNSKFNGWAINKQFVEVDEMPSGTRARSRAETIKSLTTRQVIPVDLKFQNRYEIRDTINYLYTANHIDSLYLDQNDRRLFVHHVTEEKLPEEFFRKELAPWLRTEGFSAIHHYLLNDIDLSKSIVGGNPFDATDLKPFSPNAAAPHTASRTAAISAGFSDYEEWIQEMRLAPETYLPEDKRDLTLFTANELYDAFCAINKRSNATSHQFSLELGRQGMQVNGGIQIRLKRNGSDVRLRLYSIGPETEKLNLTQIKETWERERDTE